MTAPRTREDWQRQADALVMHGQAFIDGRYCDAADGARFDCISPIDGRVLAQVADCAAADVERAVAAARRSFEAGHWSRAAPVQRKQILLRLADLIEQHADELALLESLGMGKRVSDARQGDLPGAVRCLRWTAEAIDKVYGEIAPECGGKSPNLVFADAPDLDTAAQAAATAIFYNQGQVCTAASRLLVQRSIQDEFVTRVLAHARHMQPGHPFDPDAAMGALVDNAHAEQVLAHIHRGQAEGARLLLGGKRVDVVAGGSYVQPTVFDQVDADHSIAREEIFGPVLSVLGFDHEHDALRLANDSPYGLAAGLWTRDLARAHRVARQLRAGSVWVNHWDGGDMTAPFGGYKQSGIGRDKSLHAFDKYTELKATWIHLGE